MDESKKHFKHSVRDFLMDPSFFNWIKKGDKASAIFWEKWIIQHPEKKEEFDEAVKILETLDFKAHNFDEQDQQRILSRINGSLENKLILNRYKTINHYSSIVVRYAAVFLIILSAAILYYKYYYNPFQIVRTSYGEIKTVVLPDNSIITLNANSTIKYNHRWKEKRELWMEGEGFFQVNKTKDSLKFIVHSGAINVEVIGTQFNVKNRRGLVSVVLTSGKVKLHSNEEEKKSLEMRPGEMVNYTENGKGYEIKIVKVDPYISWKNNVLVFEGITLIELATVIKDQFGKEVVFQNKDAAGFQFTGSNPADNLALLIKTLEMTFNIKIDETNNTLTIK